MTDSGDNSLEMFAKKSGCTVSKNEVEKNLPTCLKSKLSTSKKRLCKFDDCVNDNFVVIAIYHAVEERLELFLRHYAQLMDQDERINLILSTLPKDEMFTLEKKQLFFSEKSSKRFHVVR